MRPSQELLALDGAARRLGLGILRGLQRISDHSGNDERLLSCAPDFAGEAADSVLRALTDVGIELTDAELTGVPIGRRLRPTRKRPPRAR